MELGQTTIIIIDICIDIELYACSYSIIIHNIITMAHGYEE